jgi:hypothetical protein
VDFRNVLIVMTSNPYNYSPLIGKDLFDRGEASSQIILLFCPPAGAEQLPAVRLAYYPASAAGNKCCRQIESVGNDRRDYRARDDGRDESRIGMRLSQSGDIRRVVYNASLLGEPKSFVSDKRHQS